MDACSYCEDIGGKLGALVRLFRRLCVVSRSDWAMLPTVVAFVLSCRAVDDCIVASVASVALLRPEGLEEDVPW